MKKSLILIFLLGYFLIADSQIIRPNPTTGFQQFGTPVTLTRINGLLYPAVGYAPALYADTAAMNATYLKNVPLAQASTIDGKTWRRNYGCTKWEEILITSSGWGTYGNSGISTQSNFFGTTNNAGITVKTNSLNTARFDSLQRFQVENITALNDTASDFEIILIPDTQNEIDQTGAPGQAAGRAEFQWIADNAISKNIKAVIGLGDITNNGISPQLDTADAWYDRLDAANLLYVPTIGNHDYNNNNPASRNASNFLSWFGPSRISGYSWYGGNYAPAPENFFVNTTLMGRPFTILSLEYFPRTAVIAWADSLISANSNRNFIYVTHAYLDAFGERNTDTSKWGNNVTGQGADYSGQEQWDSLVKKHKNIMFTFNGHFLRETIPDLNGFSRHFTDIGDSGNVVHQFFVNYQLDTNGGNGYLVRLQFHPKTNTIDVKYYSPYLDQYDTRTGNGVESFTYQFPNIQVESNLGVTGNLAVKGEARFDGEVSFQQATKMRIPYFGENKALKDTALFHLSEDSIKVTADYFQAAQSLSSSENSTIVPTTAWTKTNFIQNQISANQSADFNVNGTQVFTRFSGGANVGYRSSLQSSLPAQVYIAQPTANYGLSLQKAATSGSYPQITYFKTNTSDFSTLATTSVGQQSGAINWMSVAPDNTTITTMARLWDFKEGGSGGLNYVGLKLSTTGAATGQLGGEMYLSGNGVLQVGGMNTATSNAYLEINGTTRGFLPPRLTTTQMNAIASPGTGLVVWNTDSAAFCSYNGTAWRIDGISALGFGSGSTNYLPKWTSATALGNSVVYDDGTNIGIGTASPSAKLHVISTTEQFRAGYDASNYYSTTVGSTGGVTFDAVGSGSSFIFSDKTLMSSARFQTAKGANVASAGDLTLGTDGNIFHITGTTTINAITTANWQAGSEIILIFDSTPTVKNNTAGGAGTAVMLLAGGADFSATANDILKLVYDGTSWFEVSRSVN